MKALVLNAENKTASVQEIPKLQPGPGEALIRVAAIGLNPVDALYTFHPLGATGRTVGSDFAGVVVEVAPDIAKDVHPGQRVAGFLQGACSANERPGAFAEFVVCPADLLWRVPDHMSLAHASAISLCALTAAQALFYRLGLPAPFDYPSSSSQQASNTNQSKDEITVFIYGASASVGLYAAQLVRRSSEATGTRIRLIGAASTARFPLLRAAPYSHDALVDYRDPAWPARVRALSVGGKGIDYALDCISEGTTVQTVCGTLNPTSGRMAVVRSRAARAWSVDGELSTEPIYGAVWEGLGVDVQYHHGIVVPASEGARKFAGAFYRWLESGNGGEAKVLAAPVRVMPGGLEKVVPDGFAVLGGGPVRERGSVQDRTEAWMAPISAEKLVYEIEGGE
ncbi:chaperonin 10-like protein [Cercophora scortea]|uniref:Chaperonin 10-like protein n=1 Tax=Cercophora scortea TaxID=314031 RepID=A0AAE0MKY7_9PEZI|nr:chaperonin 10-like protein [Cercophora scortea]